MAIYSTTCMHHHGIRSRKPLDKSCIKIVFAQYIDQLTILRIKIWQDSLYRVLSEGFCTAYAYSSTLMSLNKVAPAASSWLSQIAAT